MIWFFSWQNPCNEPDTVVYICNPFTPMRSQTAEMGGPARRSQAKVKNIVLWPLNARTHKHILIHLINKSIFKNNIAKFRKWGFFVIVHLFALFWLWFFVSFDKWQILVTEGAAQWYSTWVACPRPRIQFLTPERGQQWATLSETGKTGLWQFDLCS